MKKVLFTLATLLAFGFAANAEQAPDMGYRIGDDLVTEITLAPGASQEVDISIERMYMTMVSGMQAQWRMYDVDHNNINYDVTNKVAPGKVYGSRVKNWFEAIEHGIGDADMGNGSMAIAVGMPYDNVYRIMATNANGNMCFFRYDLEDNEMFAQKIGHFTLVASEDWDEEFATFELDLNYTTWNQCPEYDPSVFEEVKNTTPVILKVNNANFTPVQPDEVADPVITFAEENNVLTVTVSCATEGATLYVNGEQVTNPYSYTVNHENIYEEQVVNVTAYAVNGTATSETVTDSYTFAAQEKKDAPAPVITTETTDDAVIVTVTTESDGELVYDGQNSYPRQDADYTVTVTAYTKEGPTYKASETTTLDILVPAKEPVVPGETTTFVKVTSTDQLVAGKKYIFVYDNLALGAIENNAGTAVAVTVNGNEVEAGENVTVFTLGGTQYMFTLAVGDNYLRPNGASNTGISLGASASWKPAAANGGIGALSDLSDGARGLIYRASENCFRHYAKGNVGSGYEYGLLYVEKTETPVLQDLTGEIVVSQPDDNGVVTVTYTGNENVTITVNGEPVAESYQLEDGVPMTFEVVVSAEGYNDLTAEETRTWNKPIVAWNDPVVVVDDAVSADGFLYATITWEEGGDLYIDGEKVEGVTSPYRYKIAAQALYDQEGSFFCQVKGGDRPASNNVRTAWELPAREATYAPAPELIWDEATFTMTAQLPAKADYEIVLMRDGAVVENPCTVAQTYVEQTIMFSAYTKKQTEDYNSETVYKQVTVPAKEKTASAEPTISVEEGDDAYVITGQGTGTVVMYDAEGNEIANPYTVERTDEQQVIIITVENTDADTEDVMYKPTSKVFTVIVPAKEPVTPTTVGQPTFQGYTVDGVTGYGVYIFPSTPQDANIKYRVLVWDPVTEEWVVDKDWTEYNGTEKEIWFENNGEKVRVEAIAYVGDNESDVAAYEFTVETALNELMGGKTVAGVRYFNMAGQEMQEANGMTIVVTTYTDGTTSAVKVMK